MAYLPLSTANLPDPAIDPAQGSSPEDYFDIDIYTGNGTTNSRSNFTFQPDMLWFKSRSNATSWNQYTVLQGTNYLLSDQTSAEQTASNGFVSFDNDGFTLDGSGGGGEVNVNLRTYCAWAWKANGSGSTIAAGSIDGTNPTIASDVSANTTSGFSIVKFTDAGSSGTVGHGLGVKPDLIIQKPLSGTNDWYVFTEVIDGSFDFLNLNTLGAKNNSTLSAPTSAVFSNLQISGDTIAYCFHSVEGFSKFGSYEGNNLGGNDGPFVYLGFQPALVILKYTGSSNGWFMFDNAREPNNHKDQFIMADMDAFTTEFTQAARGIDFVSNGFKLRTDAAFDPNASGTYIYMAWAESPFKYSNAR